MKFLENNKIKYPLYILITLIALVLIYNIGVGNGIEKEKETRCGFTLLDINGDGMSGLVDWSCAGWKQTCESSNHNLPCVWDDVNNRCFCQLWD